MALLLLVFQCYSQDSSKCNFKATDEKLNKIYSLILQEYKTDTLFIKRLKEAQRAWLQFRNAHLEARFPTQNKNEKQTEYGSVYPECACYEMDELSKQRIRQLEAWLKGREEGDVCSGSYKTTFK
jgi:uncharacterized protein YecT (DUF1311 family)